MGLFDKIFGKKAQDTHAETEASTALNTGEQFVAASDQVAYKIIRELTEAQISSVESAPILLRTGQLYMHYWTDNLVCTDRADQEWQNKVLFFWKADEPFPKKSLPPDFETFQLKYFLFQGDTSTIFMKIGEALPWFGMPGLGAKHLCERNGESITIPELHELGFIEYVEIITLTDENLAALADVENYFFHVNEALTPFYNGNFHLDGKHISMSLAYRIGGLQLIKKQ